MLELRRERESEGVFFSSSSGMGFEVEGTPAPENHRKQTAKLLSVPTILTIGRFAAVPLLVGTFYVDSWWGTTTTCIFIIAAITDWLDGYIAWKLMDATTLILLCTRPFEFPVYGQVPWVLTVSAIAIIGRELSAVREWAASQNGCGCE